MTAVPLLLQPQRRAQWRALFDTVALGLPAALVVGVLGWRVAGWGLAILLALLTLAAVVGLGVWRARRLDQSWLIRSLDARLAAFEDSAALLFADVRALDGFRALQRRRLEARAGEAASLDLNPPWSRRSIAVAWARLTNSSLRCWWRAAMLLSASSMRPSLLLTEMPGCIPTDPPDPAQHLSPPPSSSCPSRTLGPRTAHRYRCIGAAG